MVKKALDKLNANQLAYCKTQSCLISLARANGSNLDFEKHSGKLRGFLECLCQIGLINGIELRSLYMWFFSEDRSCASAGGR